VTTAAADLVGSGTRLSAGVTAGDLLHLGAAVEQVRAAGVELIHVDVMDGVFCPTVTVGVPVVAALSGVATTDVHLMVADPIASVGAYIDAGAALLTFHVEATRHPHRVLQELAGTGVLRGVALNPGTPLEAVEPLLADVELVLLLAVNPGWPGQRFVPGTLARIERMLELTRDRGIAVGVDGGITASTIRAVAERRPHLIVAGSAVFAAGTVAVNVERLLAEIDHGRGDADA
jgi:ribulose-phosphate 3-epimerase